MSAEVPPLTVPVPWFRSVSVAPYGPAFAKSAAAGVAASMPPSNTPSADTDASELHAASDMHAARRQTDKSRQRIPWYASECIAISP